MTRCVAGEEAGFRLLYRKYAGPVYNSVYRVLNDRAAAQDILQEAFVTAFQQISKLKDQENFEGWVKRIALNKAISLLRKKKVVFVDEETFEFIDETGEDDDQLFETKVKDVKQAIMNLSDGYRTILTLHLLEGHSQEDIAKELGIGHSTVRSQYHRARKKVLQALKEKGYGREG